MPTAAKLVAAIAFAIVGWLAANAHVPALGENYNPGAFRELTALLGAIIGWRVMGGLVGQGYSDAIGSGLRTSVTLAFFALLLFGVYMMVVKSLTTNAYGSSPMNAILGIFEIMMEQGKLMISVGVIGVLLLGGVFGGIAAEWARRRWR